MSRPTGCDLHLKRDLDRSAGPRRSERRSGGRTGSCGSCRNPGSPGRRWSSPASCCSRSPPPARTCRPRCRSRRTCSRGAARDRRSASVRRLAPSGTTPDWYTTLHSRVGDHLEPRASVLGCAAGPEVPGGHVVQEDRPPSSRRRRAPRRARSAASWRGTPGPASSGCPCPGSRSPPGRPPARHGCASCAAAPRGRSPPASSRCSAACDTGSRWRRGSAAKTEPCHSAKVRSMSPPGGAWMSWQAAAHRRRAFGVPVEELGVARLVGDAVGVDVRERAAEDLVGGELQRIVVRSIDALHRVAEEACDTVEVLGHRVEVEPVGGQLLLQGHRRVALDAEAPQPTVRLALTPGVHRPEDRVLRWSRRACCPPTRSTGRDGSSGTPPGRAAAPG